MINGLGLFDRQSLPGTSASAAGVSPGGLSQPAAATGGTSFADMLTQAAGNTMSTLQQAEQISVQALQGGADTRAVVDAVMSAEQSLQAAVAIRDKIVSAYLEIGRMAI